ncbi:MAG: hypothetical protein V2I33_20415, partial [Kangiellaceae bacterium]|nr:hypothetical protein [Kangiellaceae bacterium]
NVDEKFLICCEVNKKHNLVGSKSSCTRPINMILRASDRTLAFAIAVRPEIIPSPKNEESQTYGQLEKLEHC